MDILMNTKAVSPSAGSVLPSVRGTGPTQATPPVLPVQVPSVPVSTVAPPAPAKPSDLQVLGEEINEKKFYILKAAALAIVFWALQFAYQYWVYFPGQFEMALVRSLSFSGATLIGIALILGPLSVLRSSLNFVDYRRTFGVTGFTFALLHGIMAAKVVYEFDFAGIFFSFNPFQNPVVFGYLAALFFIPLYLTSTDWAIGKLGFRTWKSVHRLVYFAFLFAILHFTQMNPPILYTPPGYLLLAVTAVAMLLELAAFVTKIRKGQAGKGTWIGAIITLIVLAMFALAFVFKNLVTG